MDFTTLELRVFIVGSIAVKLEECFSGLVGDPSLSANGETLTGTTRRLPEEGQESLGQPRENAEVAVSIPREGKFVAFLHWKEQVV